MNPSNEMKKTTVPTMIGIILMLLLTATKIVPSSQIAGYSVFVGILFFFIVEFVEKPCSEESGLRFKTLFSDLKKTGILFLGLLPALSATLTLVVGNLIFDRAFVDHVLGRTSSLLSFDQIPLLVVEVIIAAFGEEIAFRGFFVGKSMKHFPFWICVLVSSVSFSVGHIAVGAIGLVVFDIATIFIDSILYSIIYHRSENCVISTISHIICNSIGIAASFIFFI
ncbi:MAG: CPBP family intramembrane metalloprotease [bacterium]|nr:CPBP family intramembrane metalloprotease [bacterium]